MERKNRGDNYDGKREKGRERGEKESKDNYESVTGNTKRK